MAITVPDVAIVGSGPAGLALAGILEQQGISYVVFEKYARDTIPLGGCLDMHVGSGQLAFERAGCTKEFRKYARGGESTIHKVYDPEGNLAFSWGDGLDKPEMDRFHIKMALLSVVPDEKIRWSTGLTKAERDANGKILLHLTDGTVASGFKLVVGADGTWSKVRPLVTDARPKYSGKVGITGQIYPENPLYAKVQAMAGDGPQVYMGREHMVWNQIQSDGHYRCDLGSLRPANFGTEGGFDMKDAESVKRVMLTDAFFGTFCENVKTLIHAVEGPFHAWPLFYMPPEELNWAPSADVTLIGDAAHVTTPFVGEGANCAMRDSVVLAEKIKEFGFGKEAIAAYEADMQPYAADVITRSIKSGDLFYHYNSPAAYKEDMEKNGPLFEV